jgi:hypothetical protein
MSQILKVTEYEEEGIAIIEDTQGKYIATRHNANIIALDDFNAWRGNSSTPCALLQSRSSMLT